MKIKIIFIASFLLLVNTIVNSQSELIRPETYDIVVYGGTSAGVMAAVQAAKMGKNVILISPTKHLGGLSSSGLGWTDLGNSNTIGGLSLEFYQAIYNYYLNDTAWNQETRKGYIAKMENGESWDKEMVPKNGIMTTFEPHVAEEIFESFLNKYNVLVKKNLLLNREYGVVKSRGEIQSIKMLSGEIFRGKVFIDATYEGDLMAASGVSYTIGRESNNQYNEYSNGIQTEQATKNQYPIGISPFIIENDTTSGLLPGINESPGGVDDSGDKKIQAYCYRMCLTNVPNNRIKVKKPDKYNELDFEIVLRAAQKGWTKYFKLDRMPNNKTDSNNSGGISTDYIGMNYKYPEASYAERDSIGKTHVYWQQGLLWTIQNHPRVPDSIKLLYKDWGLAKDEFRDNGYWPYQIYVRESRRMISNFVITEDYCLNKLKGKRPIAYGSYAMDSHNTQRHIVQNKFGQYIIKNEGDIQIGLNKPYGIDYGSIVPNKAEANNLIVPVCLSATHIAYGSIRMEPVFMMLGQSAAVAAIIAIDDGVIVQDVNYHKLKTLLINSGQKIEYK